MIGSLSSNAAVLAVIIFMFGAFCIFTRNLPKMAYQYSSGTHSIAYVTVPNEELAKKLAKGLVEKRLAACVNIIPGIKSVYQWKGNIEEDSELLLMIKTKTDRVDDLSKYVRENHSYDVAEVISTKIENGNPPYLEWLSKSVDDK